MKQSPKGRVGMGLRLRSTARRHPLRAAMAALSATVVVLAGVGLPAHADDQGPAFRVLGKLPVRLHTANHSLPTGAVLLDTLHRRVYAWDGNGPGIFISRYDLDAVEAGQSAAEIAPRLLLQDERNITGGSAILADESNDVPIWAIDPGDGAARPTRLFQWSDGTIFEVLVDTPDADLNHDFPLWVNQGNSYPVVHTWVPGGASSDPTGTGRTVNTTTADTVAVSADALTVGDAAEKIAKPWGIAYDGGGDGPSGAHHAESLYVIGQNGKGAAIESWDAHAGAEGRDWHDPEARLRWAFVPRACTSLVVGRQGAAIFRIGDWLYTACDAFSDGSAVGIYRVRLTQADPSDPSDARPDPSTEQIFPGVTGGVDNVFADPGAERIYLSTLSHDVRTILVFDAKANGERGAYIGEIQQSLDPNSGTSITADPGTNRLYIHATEGMSSAEGSLRRVAQHGPWQESASDGAGSEMSLPGSGVLHLDPAVLDANHQLVRPARILVHYPDGNPNCPTVAGSTPPCYVALEDETPLPDTPPLPDEATLNVPEGPGLIGVYDGKASAYGVRLRAMRGPSTAWQGSFPGVSLENPPNEGQNPPKTFDGYRITDPFYYYAPEQCGSKDREVTFGRVKATTLHGNEFSQTSGADAITVDPDVHRLSTPDDEGTRNDFKDPDKCTIGMMRTMFNPIREQDSDPKGHYDAFWDGVASGLNQAGQKWPYPETTCEGDEQPPAETGSLWPPQFTDNGAPEGGGFAPATAHVTCAATADEPSSIAQTHAQLSPDPGGFPVSVQSADTSTRILRHPGEGVETIATSVVKGIDIAGAVHIDEMDVSATTVAKGYATDEGTTAKAEVHRTLLGVTINGETKCAVCTDEDLAQVVDTINSVLGPLGYARAAPNEPDVTQGTSQGTLAVVQKDQVLQDSDTVTNDDDSTEWPGLEVILYRDGQQRGRGRWEVQLGGVYSQSQFGVSSGFSDEESPPPTPPPTPTPAPKHFTGGDDGTPAVPGKPAVPSRFIPGDSGGGIPDVAAKILAVDEPLGAENAAASAPAAPTSLPQRIVHGVERSLKAAILLAFLWALIYAPAYVARRRRFLREVMGQ